MTGVNEMSKLAQLRAKTDRELVLILGNALELGLQCASANTDTTGHLRYRAEHIYTDVLMLLPKVEDVTERRRLENKLDRLSESLHGRAKTQAVCSSAC